MARNQEPSEIRPTIEEEVDSSTVPPLVYSKYQESRCCSSVIGLNCFCLHIESLSDILTKFRKNNPNEWLIGSKYMMLALGSKCQMHNCECDGWSVTPLTSNENLTKNYYYFKDCEKCDHSLASHLSHMLNGLNSIHLDTFVAFNLDRLFIENKLLKGNCDRDARMVAEHYHNLLKESVLNLSFPDLENTNPFPNEISCEEIIVNFLFYKFTTADLPVWGLGAFSARLLNEFINTWPFWGPCQSYKSKLKDPEMFVFFQVLYSRWLSVSYLPKYCKTLPYHKPSKILGMSFLREFIDFFYKDIKLMMGGDFPFIRPKGPSKFNIYFLEFVRTLRDELKKKKSPILDRNYKREVPKKTYETVSMLNEQF